MFVSKIEIKNAMWEDFIKWTNFKEKYTYFSCIDRDIEGDVNQLKALIEGIIIIKYALRVLIQANYYI